MASKKEIDEIDIRIIKRLLRNSRTSFAEIAKDCNVSTMTIKNRYNQLKKTEIIQGSTVIVDLANYGIEGDAMLYISVNDQHVDAVTNFMKKKGVFCRPSPLTESYNATVWSPVKKLSEIEKMKEILKQHPEVIDIRTSIWTYMYVIPDNLSLQPS